MSNSKLKCFDGSNEIFSVDAINGMNVSVKMNSTHANITNITVGSLIAQNISAQNFTISSIALSVPNINTTNITTSNLIASNGSVSNLVSTNAIASFSTTYNLLSTNISGDSLIINNGTINNLVATNAISSFSTTYNLLTINISSDSLITNNGKISNGTVNNLVSTNAISSFSTTYNLLTTNISGSSLIINNGNITNGTINNLVSTNAISSFSTTYNLLTTNISSDSLIINNGSMSNLSVTNLNSSNGTVTNLVTTNAICSNLLSTNISSNTLVSSNITGTNVVINNGSITNLSVTALSLQNVVLSNLTTSNILLQASNTELTSTQNNYIQGNTIGSVSGANGVYYTPTITLAAPLLTGNMWNFGGAPTHNGSDIIIAGGDINDIANNGTGPVISNAGNIYIQGGRSYVGGTIGTASTNQAGSIIFKNGITGLSNMDQSLYETMRIAPGGLIGINTSSPSCSLDITGSAKISVGLTTGSINTGNFTATNSTTPNINTQNIQVDGQIHVYDGTKAVTGGIKSEVNGRLLNIGVNTSFIGASPTNGTKGAMIRFDSRPGYSTIQMYLMSTSGTVITPLEISEAGTVIVNSIITTSFTSGTINITGNDSILLNTNSQIFSNGSGPSSDLRFASYGGLGIIIAGSSGYVGFGTSPNAPLQLSNSVLNRKVVLYDGQNNDHQFYGFGVNNGGLRYQVDDYSASHVFYSGINSSSSQELLRIKGSGSIGINTSSSSYTLDVNGTCLLRDIDIKNITSGSLACSIVTSYPYTNSANGSNSILYISHANSTTRSINASGTINASGSDYAEYMIKKDTLVSFNKGDIVGVNNQGKLTDKFSESITFLIKSTNPSLVGGDNWASELTQPIEPKNTELDTYKTDLDIYQEELSIYNKELEEKRKLVDRIAFVGQVPLNIKWTVEIGDYIVPVQGQEDNILASSINKNKITFEEYLLAIGQIINIINESQVNVIVKSI
jgi:hypothetical protein